MCHVTACGFDIPFTCGVSQRLARLANWHVWRCVEIVVPIIVHVLCHELSGIGCLRGHSSSVNTNPPLASRAAAGSDQGVWVEHHWVWGAHIGDAFIA